MENKKIELDEIGEEALDLLSNTNTSFFLTGNGGTGKTTLINHFLYENRSLPEKEQKKVQMLATTGAAAQLYDYGETYHAFFKVFGERLGSISKEQKKVMNYFQTYIIDEASMISASHYDLINKRLQQVTGNYGVLFGGKQVIFVGHLYQCSPVVTQETKEQYKEIYGDEYDSIYKTIFFFDAVSYDPNFFKIIELKKTHRTTDLELQKNLKNLMMGENLHEACNYFNKRFKNEEELDYDKAVYITNTNQKANKYNEGQLEKLKENGATIYINKAKYWNWDMDKFGKVTKEPAPLEIKYAIGARIMFTKNTDDYKNGTMGVIAGLGTYFDELTGKEAHYIKVLIDGEKAPINVFEQVWQKFESQITGEDDEGNDILEHFVTGNFRQFPFQLGWGITGHKSQGKTFDNIIVDAGMIYYKVDGIWHKKPVDHLLYVIFSRATSYKGIQVVKYIEPEAISVNKDIKAVCEKLMR